MKRCWFGLGLLVLILVLGLLSAGYMARLGEDLSRQVALAAESSQPEAVIEQVSRRWEAHKFPAAVLCDHTVLESIEEYLAILDPNTENFRELCLRLAAKFQALAQSQQLSWKNLL